jgi:hypothetical protein
MREFLKYLALPVIILAMVTFANGMTVIQQENTFEGSLVNLDQNARIIVLKNADKEMQFTFNEQTQVVGPQKKEGEPVQVKQGSKMKVTYKADEKANLATRIEVTE